MPLTCQQMQQLEADAFARGISAHDLMEEAGIGIANVIRQFHPTPGLAILYLGKGNNGGDALVAGRELKMHGWQIAARLSSEPDQLKPLPAQHWQSLQPQLWTSADAAFTFKGPVILLDGLLGIGASGALRGSMRGSMRDLAAEMNRLRTERHAAIIAMDIPSGLDGDTGTPGEDAVIADLTVTVARVKAGLLADAATHHVGRLALVPLPDLGPDDDDSLITACLLRPLLPRRTFDMHKGQAGRVAVVAGSHGYLGAAVLTCLGALRGGAGLITLMAHERNYDLLAMKVPPEIMVRPVKHYADAVEGFDVIAIGPGLGPEHDVAVQDIVRGASQPVVIDADALNALSRHGIPKNMAGPRLLTPHPGEMARLLNDRDELKSLDRKSQAESFAGEHGVTLLLKGSRTVIAAPKKTTRFNTTGTPGMACGGMGDVLTGLTAALIAQGMSLHDAASAGSWLLGRSAEIAISTAHRSEESLSATDVADHLGAAFEDLKRGAF